MGQAQLPGTEQVIASYTCGNDRHHQIPSERVRVLMMGAGYIAVCTCDGYDIETAEEKPHHLTDSVTMIGGSNLDDDLWLALDDLADGWWHENPEKEPDLGDKRSSMEIRDDYREEIRA